MKKLLISLIAAAFILPLLAYAFPILSVPQGGTGATTFPVGNCIQGNGTSAFTSGTCGASFPFTVTNYGVSTSTTLGLTNGFISSASSTVGNGTTSGGLTVNGTATTTNLYIVSKAGVGTSSPAEILELNNTANSNYTTISLWNNSVHLVTDADSVDSFNGITGYGYIGTKSNNPFVFGYNNQGQCGVYSDNTLDTLFDCYPPANGKEMTYTNSLVQPNGTVFHDNYLMNYDGSTGLIAGNIYATTKYSQALPVVVDGWWQQQNGNTSEAATSWDFFAASSTSSGTLASTTAVAIGDVSTSSLSASNGINGAGATLQFISNSARTQALGVWKDGETAANSLFTILNSGNVGISSSTPWRTLSVGGNAAIAGQTQVIGGPLDVYPVNLGSSYFFAQDGGAGKIYAGAYSDTAGAFQQLNIDGNPLVLNGRANNPITLSGLSTFTNGFISQASSTVTGNFWANNVIAGKMYVTVCGKGCDYSTSTYSSDDQALQAAVDSLPSNGGKISIGCSSGPYLINKTIVIQKHAVYLEGCDYARDTADQGDVQAGAVGLTVIRASNTFPVGSTTIAYGALGTHQIWLEGGVSKIMIDGNSRAGDLLDILNVHSVAVVSDIFENGISGVLMQSDEPGGISVDYIEHSLIRQLTGVCITLGTHSEINAARFNFLSGCVGYGILVSGINNQVIGNHIENTTIKGNGQAHDGTSIYAGGAQTYVYENDIYGQNTNIGIYTVGASSNIEDNWMANIGLLSTTTSVSHPGQSPDIFHGVGIFADGAGIGVNISGNNIVDDGGGYTDYGIYNNVDASNGGNILIFGNSVTGERIEKVHTFYPYPTMNLPLTTTGFIGAATSTPWGYLSVLAAATTSPQIVSWVSGSSSPSFIVDSANHNGNVGIGTTTPGSLFSLNNIANFTIATSTFYSTGGLSISSGCFAIGTNCISDANIGGITPIINGGTATSTQVTNGVNYFDGSKITSRTNLVYNGTGLAVGATVPDSFGTLTLNGTSAFGIALQNSGTTNTYLVQAFSNDQWTPGTVAGDFVIRKPSGNIAFTTNNGGATQLFLKSGGNIGIATTSPVYTLDVQGTMGAEGLGAAGAGDSALCLTGIQITVNSGVTTCLISSARYKHDIQTLGTSTAMKDLLALKPSTFLYNGTNKADIGIVAEQAYSVDPRLAAKNAKGQIQSLNLEDFIGILIKATQYIETQVMGILKHQSIQDQKIKALETQLQVQQKEIDALKKS